MIYEMYGFSIEAEFDIPEIARSGTVKPGHADVLIEIGALPSTLEGGRRVFENVEIKDRDVLFSFDEIGRFLVSGGKRVVVDALPNVEHHDMRAFLLGTVTGTLIHQRKLVPLHISALQAPDGLQAFSGESGAGKSTFAALLHRETGWPIFTDDVAAAHPDDENSIVYAGVHRLKLWKDSLLMLGMDQETVVRDITRADKYHLLASRMFDDTPAKLTKVTFLSWGSKEAERSVEGFKKFQSATSLVYRPELVSLTNNLPAVIKVCTKIANSTEIRDRTMKRAPDFTT